MTTIAVGPFYQPWVATPGYTPGLPNPTYPVNAPRDVISQTTKGKGVPARESTFQFTARDHAAFVRRDKLDTKIKKAYPTIEAITPGDAAGGREAALKIARHNHYAHDIQKRKLFSRAAKASHVAANEQAEHKRVIAYKEANPQRWAVKGAEAELENKLNNPNRIGRRWLEDAGGPILPMQGYESSGKGPNNVELQQRDIKSYIERRDRGYVPTQGGNTAELTKNVKSLNDMLRQAAEMGGKTLGPRRPDLNRSTLPRYP